MKNLSKWLMFVAALLVFGSCVKDDLEESTSIITNTSQPIIKTTLQGHVVDNSGLPISGAAVAYLSGDQSITVNTAADGSFVLRNVLNRGNSAYVTVNSAGKFEAFRRFSVLENRYNYTVIKMNEKKIIGSIESVAGGQVKSTDGAVVKLPMNAVVDSQGNPYNGMVNVALAWIDPSANDLAQRMVGDLSGINENGDAQALSTYGMLQVELLDVSGNELNMAEGQEAELTFPIPETMTANAEKTIPLWIYEEDLGTWVQEGYASLDESGENYVGNVPHFSSFNVDFMTDPIEIKGRVYVDELDSLNGSYLQVYVCSEKIGQKGGYLCDDGSFLFYNFPKNEVFTLKIKNRCGDVLHEVELGPFSENQCLDDIFVDNKSNMIGVTGTAENCDDEAVNNGIVSLTINNRTYTFPVDSGEFDFVVDVCDAMNGEMVITDLDNAYKSNPIPVDFNVPNQDLGLIRLCENVDEYISITVTNTLTGATNMGWFETEIGVTEINGNFKLFGYEGIDGDSNVELVTDMPTSPSYNVSANLLDGQYYDLGRDSLGSNYFYFDPNTLSGSLEFDSFENYSGGVISGSFMGQFYQEGGNQVPVDFTGDFRIIVD